MTRELKKVEDEVQTREQIEQKRVEILQKYTGQSLPQKDISSINVNIDSPTSSKKVSYTQQLMQKKKQ